MTTTKLFNPSAWCRTCGSPHQPEEKCPGELLATEPERHGFKMGARTPRGVEVYGVLIAPVGEGRWRARVITYPRIIWTVPGGGGSMKFLGKSPKEAERQAIGFLEEHCKRRRFEKVDNIPGIEVVPLQPEQKEEDKEATESKEGQRQRRKLRSVPVRFGPAQPSVEAVTGDISERGMFIVTRTFMKVGGTVKLVLELEGLTVPLRGVVRWTRKKAEAGRPAGMGIQLIRPPALYVHYVRQLP